eukprot:jgi/Picsp_1/6117/NSC_03471-R1_---NA---
MSSSSMAKYRLLIRANPWDVRSLKERKRLFAGKRSKTLLQEIEEEREQREKKFEKDREWRWIQRECCIGTKLPREPHRILDQEVKEATAEGGENISSFFPPAEREDQGQEEGNVASSSRGSQHCCDERTQFFKDECD